MTKTVVKRGGKKACARALLLLRLVTDDVVNLVFYHDPGVTAFTAALSGPQVGAPDHLLGWNVHDWELK